MIKIIAFVISLIIPVTSVFSQNTKDSSFFPKIIVVDTVEIPNLIVVSVEDGHKGISLLCNKEYFDSVKTYLQQKPITQGNIADIVDTLINDYLGQPMVWTKLFYLTYFLEYRKYSDIDKVKNVESILLFKPEGDWPHFKISRLVSNKFLQVLIEAKLFYSDSRSIIYQPFKPSLNNLYYSFLVPISSEN